MNDPIETARQLIKEVLTTCLIDHPAELVVEPRKIADGAVVYWTLQTHADDYRKVCGSAGAHIKALTFIIGELGAAADLDFKTWLKESIVGEKRPMVPVEPVEDYDPRDARDLLCRLLAGCLGSEATFAVNVSADGRRIEVPPFALLYTFEVAVRTPEDHDALANHYEDDPNKRTLAASIDVIWRAYAAKAGVAFAVKVLPLA
jgi:predicted RNA-binding protein YlqC (UPF0109 family)